MNKSKLKELITKVQRNEAFEEEFHKMFSQIFYDKIFVLAMNFRKIYFPNLPFYEVEDIVQDIFEKKFLCWSIEDYAHFLERFENFDAFIYATTRNFCKDYCKSKKKRRDKITQEEILEINYSEIPNYASKIDTLTLLATLTDRERKAVLLKAKGYTYAEIVEIANFPSKEAARMTVSRARKKLKKIEYEKV